MNTSDMTTSSVPGINDKGRAKEKDPAGDREETGGQIPGRHDRTVFQRGQYVQLPGSGNEEEIRESAGLLHAFDVFLQTAEMQISDKARILQRSQLRV